MNSTPSISKDSLFTALRSLKHAKVLIVGDLMLDRYIFGNVDRISPEAPVPVLSTTRENLHLGGAGNVAKNIQALGGAPKLVCTCGTDEESTLLRQTLKMNSLEANLIKDSSRPTTVKTRVIAHTQQIVRIDRESSDPNAPEITDQIITAIKDQLSEISVIIISDYGKGVVTKDLMLQLAAITSESGKNIKILIDPKPINFDLYRSPFLMTPNTKEAAACAGHHGIKETNDIIDTGNTIKERLGVSNLLITLGSQGMAVFTENDTIWHVPAMSQEVFDVTGAGDTVIAMMGLSIASGNSVLISSLLANYAAGIVVGEVGAASASLQQISEVIERWPLPEVKAWNSERI